MLLGIDIDTHTARAAWLDSNGSPRLVNLPHGDTVMPAVARQTMHGLVVGATAAQTLAGNTETTLSGCVRLMGHAGNIPPHLIDRLPFAVRTADGEALCNLLYAEVSAGEVYAHLVSALVEAAQTELQQPVEGVVLTVPAGAEDRFRVQAKTAVESLGITVRRLVNQPTAALLAADLPLTSRYIAVVHCGGGSTTISIAHRQDNGFKIIASAGDLLLGGDDLCWAVAQNLNQRFADTAGINVFTADRSQVAALGLRHAAEQALQTLALASQTTLSLDHGGGFGRDLVTILHRQTVDTWLKPYLEKVAGLAQRAMADAGKTADPPNTIVLTGEYAYLPALQQTIAATFGVPVAHLHTTNGTNLPVLGAALLTAATTPWVWDVTPYPLGINCYYGEQELFSPIIPANTSIPTPAAGAAHAFTEQYTTRYPDQTEVRLDILQYRGLKKPSPYAQNPVTPTECELLGSWHFTGLHPGKGSHTPFSVTFTVDQNGILHLHAHEKGTKHNLQAAVTRGIG